MPDDRFVAIGEAMNPPLRKAASRRERRNSSGGG